MQLRPSQIQAIDFAMSNVGGKTAIIGPTSIGKTLISKTISEKLPGRVAIVTYANDLVHQFAQAYPEVPVVIAKKHYNDKAHYQSHIDRAKTSKVVLFNAASYISYIEKLGSMPFDHVIMDEADSCVSLLQLQTGTSYEWTGSLEVSEADVRIIAEANKHFLANSQNYYWTVEETFDKATKEYKRSVILRPLKLQKSFITRFFPQSVVAMSATLFESDLDELFGGEKYKKLDLPSPIPVQNRLVRSFCDENYPDSHEGLAELLKSILETYKERPGIVHSTYTEAKILREITGVPTYNAKEDKVPALRLLDGTGGTLLTPGATVGLDLKYDKCRLNVILRGAFQNLGDDYVRRRKAVDPRFYGEYALKMLVQACGRSTRLPDDYSTIVVADNRVIKLACSMKHLLPNYFVEGCTFL